jgi:hypothetical protein
VIQPAHVPTFLESCCLELRAATSAAAAAAAASADAAAASAAADADAAAADAATAALPRAWLVLRSALLTELATAWLGWAGLPAFFDDFLHPDRFRGLVRAEPEMGQ